MFVHPCCLEPSHQYCFLKHPDCQSCSSGAVQVSLLSHEFLERLSSPQRLTQELLLDLMNKKLLCRPQLEDLN